MLVGLVRVAGGYLNVVEAKLVDWAAQHEDVEAHGPIEAEAAPRLAEDLNTTNE